ncbi:MAG: hypothetical protein M3N50_14650 [Pseudomonadota bacterium]|nr:hypothetical protein [Pseudomonadota bacterium]
MSMAVCAAAFAGSLQAQPAAPPAPKPPDPPAPSSLDGPDDALLEFLGADDVGDAVWWEFFKKAPLRGDSSPAAPTQDAKQ